MNTITQLNQIKENKSSSETCFKPTWYEIKIWSYLDLITSTKRAKCVATPKRLPPNKSPTGLGLELWLGLG